MEEKHSLSEKGVFYEIESFWKVEIDIKEQNNPTSIGNLEKEISTSLSWECMGMMKEESINIRSRDKDLFHIKFDIKVTLLT